MKLEKPSLFYAVLLLVHLLFFLSSVIRPPVSLSDSHDYLNASSNLYRHGVLYSGDLAEPIREEQFTRRPPLYPVFLGIGELTGSVIPVFLLQIALSLCSIFLLMRIFSSKDPDPDPGFRVAPGLLVLIFLVATPAQFIYANRIMAEVPFQLLLVLAAWSVAMYFKDREDRYIWLFNLFITLGMATKPVLFPFAILTVLISVYLFLRTRRRTFLLAITIPVIWITGYSAWNYQRVGSAQYSSIQTANMVNYNLRYFVMSQQGADAASEKVDDLYATCGAESSYKEKNECLDRGVRKIILDSLIRYAFFHLKGSARYFLDPGRFDLVTFFNIREPDNPGFLNGLNQDGVSGAIRFLKNQGWGLVIL
ncbi:MAG: hypothetical protein KAT15_06280, partial [Bacteroidales bacterium]|nr:hypothetical protein [Bacteroidales bacterium]